MADQGEYALVTGAGKGLGKAFAVELAKRKVNVLLTALPGENLEEFCQKLSDDYQIDADFIECDLTEKKEIEKVVERVKKGDYPLNILINNAGVGGTVEFEKAEESFIEDMILLNIRATTLLTHKLIPVLKKSESSWILNVASMAAFSPIGYKAVYSASKAYLLRFSKALYQELKESNVFVGAVYPGQMTTHFGVRRRIAKQGALGRLSVLSPAVTAEKALDSFFKKHKSIIVGRGNKLTWVVTKLIPGKIRVPIISSIMKRDLE